MSEVLIVAIITAVAGLLSPIVGWFLNQQGVSRRTKELQALKARIDLLEKLSDSRARYPQFDDDIETLGQREMRGVLAEIESLSETVRARLAANKSEMSRWKRASLTYDQISLKGNIYKWLFYVFALVALFGTSSALAVGDKGQWVFAIIGGVFYFLIGLAFRRAAVRTYEVDKKKSSASGKG